MFEARNPDFEIRVRDSFNRQAFMGFLGAELALVEPGVVEIALDHRHELCQQHGFFHGGVVATLVDNVGGYAGFSLMGRQDSILTVEFKINLIAPARGDRLLARGQVVKSGRTLTICEMEVFACTQDKRVKCATGLGTYMTMADTADDPVFKGGLNDDE
jgi:uncharacterized protein (TIGR00369 family)